MIVPLKENSTPFRGIFVVLLKELEIEGVSTHSFRHTALTPMSDAGVPRWHIQAISGHKTLAALERYLGVTEQQKQTAISTLDF